MKKVPFFAKYLEGQTTDALWVHAVDLHPNEKAHALIASTLLPWVRRELE